MFDEQTTTDPAGFDTAQSSATTSEPSLEELREQLAGAVARSEENHNKFLLAMADFENYKRRMQRDIENLVSGHRRMLLEKFLPVIDNLERALQYDTASDGLRGGVEQTLRGFEAILTAEGARTIDVKDKPFDPRVAEAIGTVAAHGDVADDTVVDVAQKGYVLGEELLRPARVIVAKRHG
ncbi:MAG: nucleotide exchange factor GrpE [Vulcanimicrobiaceae bacterium]